MTFSKHMNRIQTFFAQCRLTALAAQIACGVALLAGCRNDAGTFSAVGGETRGIAAFANVMR